jgi:hypothetical protein
MSSRAEPPCCALHAHTTCRTPGGVWVDVLVCGLDRELDIDPDDDDSYPDLPDAMHFVAEHGGVAYIAHPYWTGVPMDPGGRAAGRRRHRGLPCFAVACDDTHYAGFDSGYAWTMAHAAEPTAEGVVAAPRSGACYVAL